MSGLPDHDALLARVRRYVEIETPSGDVERMAALHALVAADLAATGAAVESVDAPGYGAHVIARRGGDDRDPLLLLGHLDTVHPVGTLDTLPFRVADGRAWGPGIFDMKAPVALLVEALARGPRGRPVVVLLTCDEEVGSPTSRGLIERTARGCAAVLVLEPPLPDGSAKTARKGVGMYEVTTRGRAAHAGIEPEAGIDAIAEIAHLASRIYELADPGRGTTVTVGRIAGGTASNVVAAQAWADIDVRFATPDEGERVDRALRSLAPRDERVRVALEGGLNRPPLVRTAAVANLYEQARAHARDAGFDLGEGSTGGGSDGCFTAAIGVPTLDGLGVPGAGAHTLDEHIQVTTLTQRFDFLCRLLEHL